MTGLGDVLALAGAAEMPAPGELRWADPAAVGRVRAMVRQGLLEGALLSDCIALELEALRARDIGGGLSPFAVGGGGRARVAFGYWAPGEQAGAHEHHDWAVTAVVHNALEVRTFDYAAARDEHRLVQKNVFAAERGQVGSICEPCVHDPANRTGAWSVSLHVFGPNDRAVLAERGVAGLRPIHEGPPPPPADDVVARWHVARRRGQAHRHLARMLSEVGTERALALRETIDPCALAASGGVGLRTELHRTVPSALEVRLGERAELVLGRGAAEVVLLRLNLAAAPLLRFLADSDSFRATELPGAYRECDRLTLARATVECGLFAPLSRWRGAA